MKDLVMGPLSRIVSETLARLAEEMERYEDITEMSPEDQRAAFADMLTARHGLLGGAKVLDKLVGWRRLYAEVKRFLWRSDG